MFVNRTPPRAPFAYIQTSKFRTTKKSTHQSQTFMKYHVTSTTNQNS